MKFINNLIRYFVYINTGVVFVFIVMLLIEGGDGISFKTLIRIPCAAFITALVTAIVYSKEATTKKGIYIRIFVHYLLLCIVMLTFGTAVEWVKFNLGGVITMVISTTAIYVFTFFGVYISSKKDAENLNRALKNKREQKK